MKKEYIIRPIVDETSYKKALKTIDEIIEQDPEEGSELDNVLDAISTLVERYEEKHYPMEDADAIDVLKFVMEDRGLKQKDLIPFLGPKSRVSEILNRKTKLSAEQIFRLHKGLNIPLGAMINEATFTHCMVNEEEMKYGDQKKKSS